MGAGIQTTAAGFHNRNIMALLKVSNATSTALPVVVSIIEILWLY